jgi:5-methylcytosine-specific restriction endonuclease McrA
VSVLTVQALGELSAFIAASPWEQADISRVAALGGYARGGARNQAIIESDLLLNDAFWRILSILDPLQIPQDQQTYAHIFARLRVALAQELSVAPSEVSAPARAIARALLAEIGRYNTVRREEIPPTVRRELVESSDLPINCWYCGYVFPESQVETFVGGRQILPGQPLFVDCIAPRGRVATDLRLEIDHLMPASLGGAGVVENTRIACGWCNRHKSAIASLYDAPSRPQLLRHPRVGPMLAPVPFWVVRIRGSRRRCEHFEGCLLSIEGGSEMYIAKVRSEGAFVPGNLGVYCEGHDPFREERFIVNALW